MTPAFIARLTKRLPLILITACLLVAGYQFTNRFHLRLAQWLPLTALDRAIPFWPWTVWPYLVLALSVLLPCALRDEARFRQVLTALWLAELMNFSVYLLWPINYPRPSLNESPYAVDALSALACKWLWYADAPANCLPSGHITGPAIGYWAVASEHPRWRKWLWTLFALLALSTLTMKQHYVIDLPAGLLTAAFGLWISQQWKPLTRA